MANPRRSRNVAVGKGRRDQRRTASSAPHQSLLGDPRGDRGHDCSRDRYHRCLAGIVDIGQALVAEPWGFRKGKRLLGPNFIGLLQSPAIFPPVSLSQLNKTLPSKPMRAGFFFIYRHLSVISVCSALTMYQGRNDPWVAGERTDPFAALLVLLVLGAIAAGLLLLLHS